MRLRLGILGQDPGARENGEKNPYQKAGRWKENRSAWTRDIDDVAEEWPEKLLEYIRREETHRRDEINNEEKQR